MVSGKVSERGCSVLARDVIECCSYIASGQGKDL